jgi:hypothetical protein
MPLQAMREEADEEVEEVGCGDALRSFFEEEREGGIAFCVVAFGPLFLGIAAPLRRVSNPKVIILTSSAC